VTTRETKTSFEPDCDPADILAPDLDFTGVQSCPQGQPHLLSGGAECERATHRPAGPIEGRQNAVAGILHQISTVPADYLLCELVVIIEQAAPALVAQ
jgi:hypothetical protein